MLYEDKVKAIIEAMQKKGAIYQKHDSTHMYFKIPLNTKILEGDGLFKAKQGIKELLDLTLRVKYLKE